MENFEQFSKILGTIGLFKGIGAAQLKPMLDCIGAWVKNTKKGEIILLSGDKPAFIGIALSGQFNILREDYNGNPTLLAAIMSGEIFAEALCCAGVSESPVTVISATNSSFIKLMFSRILHTCPKSCSFHRKLVENLLELLAKKNILLQNRMEIISLKSVREKVMHYLESFAQKQGETITLPFNREEMANFLCVERSALSHELAKMKKDGLIEYRKNRFTIIIPNLSACLQNPSH